VSFLEHFSDLWVPEPNTGCFLWLGSLDFEGYARRSIGDKMYRMNRLVCEETHGSPPTPKHEAAHATPIGCVGRSCISPEHLRWATSTENKRDMTPEARSEKARKGRAGMTLERRREIALKGRRTREGI
jgi:hypothetical protein